jgi:PAS domain S-box-containing protein
MISDEKDLSVQNDSQRSAQDSDTMRAIFNSLAEGVIVADKKGKFTLFNTAAERILGLGAMDLALEQWSHVYGIYRLDEVTPYPSEELPLARAIKGEEVIDELLFIKNESRPQGLYVNVSASPIKDRIGSVSGGAIIFRDITKRILAERALEQREERLRAQFKGFPIPTYTWQHKEDDLILIEYNDAAEDFNQGLVENFVGLNFREMYADSPHLEDIESDFLRCLNEKTVVVREMTYHFQSTKEIKELTVTYVFVDPDLILVHTEDITERKKVENELRKLSNAIEQTADSVIITNKKGVIEYVNYGFEAVTGFSSDEAIGQTPRILKSGHHPQAFYEDLWSQISGGNHYRGTVLNKKKSGELYWSEQTISPLKDDLGNITNYVSVLRDISELKKKEEQDIQLSIARRIQQQYYPSAISVPGLDIAGSTFPADETGGDYFDFILTKDGALWIAVGDVVDHGIASALVMAETRAYLRSFCKLVSDPAKVLEMVNRGLTEETQDDRYVTMILARIDPVERTLVYANAGHIPGHLFNHSGEILRVMKNTGMPLGVVRDIDISSVELIELCPEDIVFFYTDGITEARDPDGNEYGIDKVIDVMMRSRETHSHEMIEQLYHAVRSFSAHTTQDDDVTLVICKVNPQEG